MAGLYMGERCGAWQVGDARDGGAIEFRIFLPPDVDPEIEEVRVAGTFGPRLGLAEWDFAGGLLLQESARRGGGTFWSATTPAPVPAGFYEYKYAVRFAGVPQARIVTDPCARYGGFTDANAAVVVGGSSPAENVVAPLTGGRSPLADLNVYELMIDDFTAGYRGPRAPLDAVVDKLDDLVAMGFNAILFMPWTAWGSSDFDWGYAPFQFFSVEPRYADAWGRPEEKLAWLKRLVSACHARGIHVIMDGVYNHVTPRFPYPQLYKHPERCPYVGTFGGTFPGLADLDFDNACTREFILDVCLYWIGSFGIDGIRFDNTTNFYEPGDTHGVPDLLTEIQAALDARGERNFSLTLEHIDIAAAEVVKATRATSYWDNSLYHLARDGLTGSGIDARLLGALNPRRWLRPFEDKVPTVYLSNHDHSQLGGLVGTTGEPGASARWFEIQPWVIALFTGTGTPMIPNGQELGEEHLLPEDDHGTSRRVLSRPLRWKLAGDPIGAALSRLHTRMATLRLEHPALRSGHMHPDAWEDWRTELDPDGVGVDVARQLVIFHRWAELDDGGVENAVIALNFGDAEQQADLPFPLDGEWTDLLSDPLFTPAVTGGRLRCAIPSHWGRVFVRQA